jgi:phosphopantothenoylcysteine decarboxylase/phosphopantothenate--cysteine ligase
VGDYTVEPSPQKIKREGELVLRLKITEDILADLPRRPGQTVVGFAAESESLEENAARKLRRKKLDLIIATDITSSEWGFGSDYNRALLLRADGSRKEFESMRKSEMADRILDEVELLIRPERVIS